MSKLRLSIAVVACAVCSAAFAGSASAGVADYETTYGFGIPNNTGIGGIPSTVFVPPGRTAVQKLEVTNLQPTFTGGGGGDLELRLVSPSNTELTLFAGGCGTFPNTTIFSMNDEAADPAGSPNFCNTQLNGGQGRPSNIDNENFSIFNGQPSAGVWTMVVRDVGIQAGLGLWKGWNLRITHAPLALAAGAGRQKLASSQLLRARCNADCTLRIGGAARPSSQKLVAESQTSLAIKLKRKIVRRVKRRGKGVARISLTATDPTGDVATRAVRMKLRR